MRRILMAVFGAIVVLTPITACSSVAEGPNDQTTTTAGSASGPAVHSWDNPPRTSTEAAAAMATCMQRLGWTVTAEGGSMVGFVPPEQRDQHQADMTICATETGADAPGETLDAAFARKQFDRTGAFRDCLVASGYEPPELPSYQAYEDALLVQGNILDLAGDAGIDQDDPVRESCGDPMLSWGRGD